MSFVLTLVAVLAAVHAYLWKRLVRDTRQSRAAAAIATLLLLLLLLSIPAALMSARSSGGESSRLVFFAYAWLGAMFYLLTVLAAVDVVRFPLRTWAWLRGRLSQHKGEASATRSEAPEPVLAALSPARLPEGNALETRRTFVARSIATSALVATAGVSALGMRNVWDITRPEVPVRLARLPKALDGYTIALLSDIHIGPTLDGRFLRHLVEQTNGLRPDAIVVVGDLVDGSVAQLGPQVAELGGMRARDGLYFVTGNHEYYSGAAQWVSFLRSLGVRVLQNERVVLGDRSSAGAQFDLAGVPDQHAARFPPFVGPNPQSAVAGRDVERELVVLAHQPVQIYDVAQVAPGLQLSGHTHGGQMVPFDALTALVQPYVAGLHHHPGGDSQVYVSRGSGYWGPPMRVDAPAEITAVRLIAG